MDRLGLMTEKAGALWQSGWFLTGDARKVEDLVQTALARVEHIAKESAQSHRSGGCRRSAACRCRRAAEAIDLHCRASLEPGRDESSRALPPCAVSSPVSPTGIQSMSLP